MGGGKSLKPHLGWSFKYYEAAWSPNTDSKARQDKESEISQRNLQILSDLKETENCCGF